MKMYQGESCDITLKITDDNGAPFALGDKCLTLFLTRRGEIVPGVRATTRERDGYLHVIVPRGELTWQTDWDGTYGFVKEADVAVGISKTDAMYKK